MNGSAIIMVSGGFDILHVGHIELFDKAAKFGQVHVLLNSDAWLKRKRGERAFMPWDERAVLLENLKNVERIWTFDDGDDTAIQGIRDVVTRFEHLGFAFLFGNGGDRTQLNTPEIDVCVELGVGLVWNLGKEMSSSSDFVKRASENRKRFEQVFDHSNTLRGK